MYAQLGNIIFQNLLGFSEYSKTGSATYAEHKLLTGKPLLQPTGPTLDVVTVSMRFHASFCNPQQMLDALKKYRDTNEIVPLISNNTIDGPFVITDITETVEDADFEGNIFSYLVNCTLKEFVVSDQLVAEQEAARKAAAAVGNKTPVNKPKTNPPTCPQAIRKDVSTIKSRAGAINTIMTVKGGTSAITMIAQTNRDSVTGHLKKIASISQGLMTKAADPTNCASKQAGFADAAKVVNISANNWIANINVPDSQQGENQNLQNVVANLNTAAMTLMQQSITLQS